MYVMHYVNERCCVGNVMMMCSVVLLLTGTYILTDNGECGWYSYAVFFCVTYILITFQIIVNCYIALILETYEELSKVS